MATTKSSMGENRVPKPGNQGSSKTNSPRPPAVSKTSGGFMKPTANQSRRVAPANSGGRGVGGTGNGPGKGNSLPR